MPTWLVILIVVIVLAALGVGGYFAFKWIHSGGGGTGACTTDADCKPPNFCDVTYHMCGNGGLTPGTTCNASAQCASGACGHNTNSEHDKTSCCASGKTFHVNCNNTEVCTDHLTQGQQCRVDAQCHGGLECKDNAGCKFGTCQPKT